MTSSQQAAGADAERIDVDDPRACAAWARKLDASQDELRDAVRAVGDKATDVEMHLKGSRATTNSDRVKQELDRG